MRKCNLVKAINKTSTSIELGGIANTNDRTGREGRSISGNIKNIGSSESMIRNSMLLCLVAFCAFVISTPATAGDVAFVSASAKPGGDGSSWETAFDDLQDAIDLASNAKNGITQIWVTAGVYKPDRGSGDRDASYKMLNGVGFYGGFVGGEKSLEERDPNTNETTLSADLQDNDVPGAGILDPSVFDNSYHVLIAENVYATARLDGFSIVGGTAHGSPFPRNVGGGILVDVASPTIENCKFVDNKGLDGGAVRILVGGSPSFANCEFINSYSNSRGGGILGTATVTGCSFTGNFAETEGGAVHSAKLIVDCTFIDNFSRSRGGAIKTVSAKIISCTFTGNIAGEENGGVGTNGGAVWCSGSTEIIDCEFSGNLSREGIGGAIYNDSGNIIVRDCNFVENQAQSSGSGGAIFAGGINTIINCLFEGNLAGRRGGAIRATSGFINSSVFRDNLAGMEGGAVYVSSSNLNILNSRFQGNTCIENGGAIYAINNADLFLDSCLFTGNSAIIDGGAIFNSLSAPNLQAVNCSIYANFAGQNGGGLFIDYDGTADVNNSIFWNNTDVINGSTEAAQIFIGPNSGLLNINYSLVDNLTGNLGGTGNIADDPMFVDADGVDNIPGTEDDDLHLMPGSPCIDAADNSIVLNCVLDLDSNRRFIDDPNTRDSGVGKPPIVDMGSYEFGSIPLVDCNYNGLWDDCEVLEQLALDCNGNTIPDECDIDVGFSDDCNLNGIPDECDIIDFDCNGNGIPDDCDIANGFSFDCNNNGVPDICDIDNDFSSDCNFNGIPDECDIVNGFSLDCNNNGIPDSCDIEDGFSSDCNLNGIPDECDADCNFNGIPDDCDIADLALLDCNQDGVLDECQGLFFDCNFNGIEDACEIAAGFAEDCNENGRPDDCDLTGIFNVDSGFLSPLGNGFPHSIPLSNLPIAMSDVTLSFTAISDLSSSSERVTVFINSIQIGVVFNSGANDCPLIPDEDQLILTAIEYNDLITDGTAVVDLVATSSVNSVQCGDGTFIRMNLNYTGFESLEDLDNNGIPDECDIPGDLNRDGVVSISDLLILFSVWGPCADCVPCLGDLDGNCNIDTIDLLILFANWG